MKYSSFKFSRERPVKVLGNVLEMCCCNHKIDQTKRHPPPPPRHFPASSQPILTPYSGYVLKTIIKGIICHFPF